METSSLRNQELFQMSEKKSDGGINVLQNIVLETRSLKNILEQTNYNGRLNIYNDKEYNSDKNVTKHRYTGSTYIFEEEPVFSDSDEEGQYCKNILAATQKCFNSTNTTSKTLETEVQYNLSADDLEIMNVMKQCTSVNVENVNDDFKQLINLCKELHTKYTLSTSVVTTNNELVDKEVFASRNSTSQNLKNVDKFISMQIADDQFSQANLIPSRNGNSSGANGFYFQAFSSDSGFSNVSFITECTNSSEEKENVVRRSGRIRKPLNTNKSGIFITRKESKLLNRSRKQVKTENVGVKRKNSSNTFFPKNINGISALKQKKVNKGVSNARTSRNDKRYIERKNKSPLVKSAKSKKKYKVQMGRNEERNKHKNKSRLNKNIKPKWIASLNEFRDDFFHVKAQYLPTKERRSLAKNWMKPNKNIVKNILPENGSNSMQQKQKLRRLYSPDDWLHSKEFESICLKSKN